MSVYHVDLGRFQPSTEPDETLAVTEAKAARLLSISPRTLWQLRHDGLGPAHAMIGSSVRYAVAELHRYVADKQVESKASGKGGAA